MREPVLRDRYRGLRNRLEYLMRLIPSAIATLLLTAAPAFAEFTISFDWGDIPLCTTGRPGKVDNPRFVVKGLPEGTTRIVFRLKDLDVPAIITAAARLRSVRTESSNPVLSGTKAPVRQAAATPMSGPPKRKRDQRHWPRPKRGATILTEGRCAPAPCRPYGRASLGHGSLREPEGALPLGLTASPQDICGKKKRISARRCGTAGSSGKESSQDRWGRRRCSLPWGGVACAIGARKVQNHCPAWHPGSSDR